MNRWSFLLLVGLVVLSPFRTLEAQVSFGPQLVLWGFEDAGVGGRVDIAIPASFGIEAGPLGGLFVSLNGSYLFVKGNATTLTFNGAVAIPVEVAGPVEPYVGAGINHWRWSSPNIAETERINYSGLNLLGGILFDLGTIPTFGELLYSTTNDGFLSFSAGFLFGS